MSGASPGLQAGVSHDYNGVPRPRDVIQPREMDKIEQEIVALGVPSCVDALRESLENKSSSAFSSE